MKALQSAQKDLAATMAILRIRTAGGNADLLEATENNRKFFEQLKLQINAALPGKKNEAERNAQRAEADVLRGKEEERIRRDYERTQRERREDLDVRGLRAMGKGSEADKLALEIQQQREREEAKAAGADEAYIARLKEIQALEKAALEIDKTADALKRLTTEVRNAPSGFKVESYINQFATPRSSGWETGLGFAPKTLPATAQPVVINLRDAKFTIDGSKSPEETLNSFVRVLRVKANAVTGPNTALSTALDYFG